ncbi:MAG: methyltransferase [Alphaproteobacteria bacterium]|nr:methyltransferase [Alphaproteobacteria bacterium]
MADIIPIADSTDPRIDAYRDIRERDLVGRAGLFVAEGKVVLSMLLASPAYRPQSLLIAERRIASILPMLSDLSEEVPVYSAARPVLDAIAGFPLHRGILAIGRRLETPGPDALLAALPAQATVLLLSAIANHDNIGGIFRNAAAFGADAVLLDSDCCDPLYRKAIRVSVGTVLTVPFARLAPGEDALALLDRHGLEALALSPEGRLVLNGWTPPERAAILLGAEGPGLAPELLARAISVRIPMAAGVDSLNVATTSGIVLHHVAAMRPCRAAAG